MGSSTLLTPLGTNCTSIFAGGFRNLYFLQHPRSRVYNDSLRLQAAGAMDGSVRPGFGEGPQDKTRPRAPALLLGTGSEASLRHRAQSTDDKHQGGDRPRSSVSGSGPVDPKGHAPSGPRPSREEAGRPQRPRAQLQTPSVSQGTQPICAHQVGTRPGQEGGDS